MADSKKLYPRTGDTQTIYLKNAITSPDIVVGDYIHCRLKATATRDKRKG